MTGCNAHRVLITVVIVLALATLVLVGILAWRENTRGKVERVRLSNQSTLKAFPGFLRSPEQQQDFARQFFSGFDNRTEVTNKTTPATNETCTFSCNSKFPSRKKRQTSGGVYHGCCYSSVMFVAPLTKNDVFGKPRILLQFESLKQYFAVNLCQSVPNCSGCICSQENNVHTAVVLKPGINEAEYVDELEVDMFFFPGCCKCVNV